MFEFYNKPENCEKCGSERGEFDYAELSIETKKIWDKTGLVSSIRYFLLCSECNELTPVFEEE